ncbi:formimidoylglutamase [Salinicoccus hispanicus]|uniref:Formimidoylglutamase n=1 Tax=Salinicoccus hispanicus TaxID=157225 RepID=A0A6N8TUZ5_9STAP|nr:formimidoylglutamase [Salinicoccus hispanicus]MXQ49728.1 formimidoylglutamase [Salinicoccus hispanicus]
MKNIEQHDYAGRVDNPEIKERLHQVISQWDSSTPSGAPVFIGFRSEEGVKRNKGRRGAFDGPVVVRQKLASMPYEKPVFDYGSILGDHDLEASQTALGQSVAAVLSNNQFPLIIGGGHETLYGHYLGVRQAFPDKKLAVVNFDAHFDLRDEQPSSGTMFHQILSDDPDIDYYVFGIQESGNTASLFRTADRFGVRYALMNEVRNTDVYTRVLEELKEYDAVFATLCMDSVQQSVAPGTSAPAQNGYTACEIHDMVAQLAKLENLTSFDISEVAPALDIDDRTSSLAASLFHSFMTERETFQ